MTDILNQVKLFQQNIYYNMPAKINEDYMTICTNFSVWYDNAFGLDDTVKTIKNECLMSLLMAMETKDYILMAEKLSLTIVPIIEKYMGGSEG